MLATYLAVSWGYVIASFVPCTSTRHLEYKNAYYAVARDCIILCSMVMHVCDYTKKVTSQEALSTVTSDESVEL